MRRRPQGFPLYRHRGYGQCHRDRCPRWSAGKYGEQPQRLPRRYTNCTYHPAFSCSHKWHSWW
ncbi:hypothetical protein EVA_10830 [gut metagenome]|uniref:Uncharacterized protein n=1 Tax=gut metagenome TaxID=749906 RepID=J9GGX3_9ZZZZ